jgi:hypothetical protein
MLLNGCHVTERMPCTEWAVVSRRCSFADSWSVVWCDSQCEGQHVRGEPHFEMSMSQHATPWHAVTASSSVDRHAVFRAAAVRALHGQMPRSAARPSALAAFANVQGVACVWTDDASLLAAARLEIVGKSTQR